MVCGGYEVSLQPLSLNDPMVRMLKVMPVLGYQLLVLLCEGIGGHALVDKDPWVQTQPKKKR
jgi:hypothetical protein